MKDKKIFVDTNILVYAHDRSAGKKHALAREKVKELWDQDTAPSISIQVLQELYVNLIRKNVLEKNAKETIKDYLEWDVLQNDQELLMTGIENKERYKLSFWDALILAAAQKSQSSILLSEDFQNKRNFGDVTVLNPFKD